MKFVGGGGGEGVNQQSTQRESAEKLKFVGGEGGELECRSTVKTKRICREVEIYRWGGRGRWVNQQSTQRGSAEKLKFVGGEGVNQQSTQTGTVERLKFCRWGGGVDKQST